MARKLAVLIILLGAVASGAFAGFGGTWTSFGPWSTGENLVDPGADKLVSWDDSAGTMVWTTSAPADSIDTDAIVNEAVTLAKMADGTATGDMLKWNEAGSTWIYFDANEPNDVLVLNDSNEPVWVKQAITVENNITNNIINQLKLKKTATFDTGDILTIAAANNEFTGLSLIELTAAYPMTPNPAGLTQTYRFNMADPITLQTADSEWCIDARTSAAMTITRIDITADADPTTEFDWDLKFCDAFIGQANTTLIVAMDTTAGAAAITSFTDATIPANKCIMVVFGAAPDAAQLQVQVTIYWDYDQP